MFFSQAKVTPYIPDEFWTENLNMALKEAISNFNKYEAKINKQVYLDDLSKCLASYAIREVAS
jgi:hypothetical protein